MAGEEGVYRLAPDRIEFTAGADIPAGTVLVVAGVGGVTTQQFSSGDKAALAIEGQFDVIKIAAQAWTAGDVIYWDNTNKWATNVASDFKLGRAVANQDAADTTARVLLERDYS